ncbi:MAG: histidine kinase dimerization/phospho-acceptor domain-containing protein [Candidatus Acidiferrales bacterium]
MKRNTEAFEETPVKNCKMLAVLIGMPEGQERQELVRSVRNASSIQEIGTASVFTELESRAARDLPGVIVFSEKVLCAGTLLAEATHRLTAFAPVVVLASSARQSEIVGLVVSGEVDFVALSGEFASVAAAFVERRLNSPQGYSREFRSAWTADVPSDFAELLRHEINNPLTGILGNAELLLSQLRGNLPPLSVQRLETVVDLAVRLREKVRRLAAEPRRRESSVRSA